MFSFVICSIDGAKLARFEASLARAMGAELYEVIRIHDAKSLSEGLNRGLRQSTGSVIVFCHDDIEFLVQDFSRKLSSHLQHVDIVGVAGTSKVIDGLWTRCGQSHVHGHIGHYQPENSEMPFFASMYDFAVPALEGSALTLGIQGLDGVFLAMHRETAIELGFDESVFDGFHGYDLDFTYRAHLAGKCLGVASNLGILHYSRGNHDSAWEGYNDKFRAKHAATLPPWTPDEPTVGAMVLYRTKEELAKSFTLEEQVRLAKKFAEQIRGETTVRPRSLLGQWTRKLRSIFRYPTTH